MEIVCPKCGGRIRSKKVKSGRWLLSCTDCKMCFAADSTDLSKKKAYENMKQRYEEGALTNDGMTWVRKYGLGKQLKALDMGLKNKDLEDLPPDAQSVVRGKDEVVDYRFMEPSRPEYGPDVDEIGLDEDIVSGVKARGIDKFYEFQKEAIESIIEGKNVVISAPTATGKTEAFILPIYQKIMEEREVDSERARALLIYPTKTLGRDQLEKLESLGSKAGIDVEVYDGDTSTSERKKIREDPPDALITNFDMVNFHLAHGTRFADMIRSVRFIVMDEIHQYKGSFGSNVHFLLERMDRVFEEDLQMVGASATIRNTKEFSENLFGEDVEVISCEEGRHGPIHFLMLYPKGRSANTLLIQNLKRLNRNERKTVVFGQSQQQVESLARMARNKNIDTEVHRAGLGRDYRRDVEERLREGDLKTVCSTPTLELGVDIGDLDAVESSIVGITRFKQRIGRIARRGQEGIAILALRDDDPISSYYRNHPDDYFEDVEPGYVEPENPIVARHQLIGAAMDKPLSQDEFGNFEGLLEDAEESGLLKRSAGGLRPTETGKERFKNYSIRGIGETVQLLDKNGKKIGRRRMPIAIKELHPGAVYLHGGGSYRSKFLDVEDEPKKAILEESKAENVHTIAQKATVPRVKKVLDKRKVHGVETLYCSLEIKDRVDAYWEKNTVTGEILRKQSLDEPIDYSYRTLGFVFKAPEPAVADLKGESKDDKLAGTYHAVEHALLETSNMLTGSGSTEIGGVAMGTTGHIFAYDGSPGGNGVTRLLYSRMEEAVERAHSILSDCGCRSENGCPKCVQAYQCGSNNRPLSRPGAIGSLEGIMEGEDTKVGKREFPRDDSIV